MRTFTTDARFNITDDNNLAQHLFEEVERYANGFRIKLQHKNENGKWGGRGDDVEFTVRANSITPQRVVKAYLDELRAEEDQVESARFEAEHS